MNNYIGLAVRQYEEMQRGKRRSIRERSIRKIEKDAFKELVREYPELYDYYIRLRETDVDKIRSQSLAELNEQIEKLCVASQNIISILIYNGVNGVDIFKYRLCKRRGKSKTEIFQTYY